MLLFFKFRDFSSTTEYSLANAIEDITALVDLIGGLDTSSSIFGDVEYLAQLLRSVNDIGGFVTDILNGDDIENLEV